MDKNACLNLINLIQTGTLEEVAAYYTEQPAAFSTKLYNDGKYALHFAASLGRLDLVEFILTKEPDALELKDDFNQTALLLAAAKGQLAVIEYLMLKDANCKVRTSRSMDTENYSVIDWARRSNHPDCVDLIYKLQLFRARKILEATGDPQADSMNKVSQICDLIITENTSGLIYILEQTPYFQELPEERRLFLLKKAHATLDHDLLKTFINPRHWPVRVINGRYTLLEWAVAQGQDKLLDIFIEAEPEVILSRINERSDDPAKQNLLDLAKHYKNYAMLNYLILHSFSCFNNQVAQQADLAASSSDVITWPLDARFSDYICTGRQLMDLAGSEPGLQPRLTRIKNYKELLSDDQNVEQQKGGVRRNYFFGTRRRRSIDLRVNTKSGTFDVFEFSRNLAKGTYGSARLFCAASGEEEVVKTFYALDSGSLSNEMYFLRQVYPGQTIFGAIDPVQKQARLVMPYFKGVPFYTACKSTQSELQLAQLIYALAREVYRIHDKAEVIHGDIRSPNIVVDKVEERWIVNLIDCGMTYSKVANSAVILDENFNTRGYPPERIGNGRTVIPDVNQDVYMLGYIMRSGIKKAEMTDKIAAQFPLIKEFIDLAQAEAPARRPSLRTFCHHLNRELRAAEKAMAQAGPSMSC